MKNLIRDLASLIAVAFPIDCDLDPNVREYGVGPQQLIDKERIIANSAL